VILIADDNEPLTQFLRERLEEAGFEVRVARDGVAAYRMVRDPKCRAMLLGIHMPGVNGAELLMLMAADGIRVPVVVMTAHPDFDESEMKQFPNVRRLLHKPVYPEDVRDALLACIEKPAG